MKKLVLFLLITTQLHTVNFLGYSIKNPVGLSACILGTSKHIKELAQKECSVLTYKSVRSHPATRSSLATGLSVDTDYNLMQPISIGHSYGIETEKASKVITDIQAARESLGKDQILIVSIYPQEYPGTSRAQDAHYLAQLVKQAGAQAIEINIACPNVHEQPLYHDLKKLKAICKETVKGAGDFPVLIKIGYISDKQILRDVVKTAINAGIRGITSMNSIATEILEITVKQPVSTHPITGISKANIRILALEQIAELVKIREEENLDFDIAGVGGITQPEHFDLFLNAGATVALSATALIHDHELVKKYIQNIKNR